MYFLSRNTIDIYFVLEVSRKNPPNISKIHFVVTYIFKSRLVLDKGVAVLHTSQRQQAEEHRCLVASIHTPCWKNWKMKGKKYGRMLETLCFVINRAGAKFRIRQTMRIHKGMRQL